jgi:hypothetical protein
LFLGWCTPSFEEHRGLELVFSSIHEGSDSDVSPFVIGIFLALDEQSKLGILSSLIPLEDIYKKVCIVVSPLASRAITWVLTYALNLEMSESKAIILVSREDRAVRMNETVVLVST